MAFLRRARRAGSSKVRRQRGRWFGSTVFFAFACGLVMAMNMLFHQSRLGVRRRVLHGAALPSTVQEAPTRELAGSKPLPLSVTIIDARQATRPDTAVSSHMELTNALCMPARLGVFAAADPQWPGSHATILVDDPASAARINSDWWFGNAARPGGVDDGRRAAVAAMEAGRGFVVAPASALWTQDLREALFTRTPGHATDRPGGHVDLTCDVAMADSTGEPSIFGVRPTRGGRRFVEAVMQCEAAKVALAGRRHGPTGSGAGTSQPDEPYPFIFSPACLRDAAATTSPDVRVCVPSRPGFHMSLREFEERGPAKTGLWPAAVVVEAHRESASDLQARGLWALAPDGTCPLTLPFSGAGVAPPPAPPPPFSLRIRVLTMARPTSLRRLLDSMQVADYLGDAVSLDFMVDALPDDADVDALAHAATAAARADTVATVLGFAWPHGPMSVDIAVKPRGLINQWLAWRPDRDDEACLVLEDDMQVAPTFYAWAKPRLAAYWAAGTRTSDDVPASRLSAISLSLQNKVVGEVDGVQVYGHTDIGRFLADGAPPAYLASQVSSWAPILLPRPWRHFVNWWEQDRLQLPTRHYLNGTKVGPSPCLPGLASNQWWSKAPDTMWTVWWHRFAVATGYVVLYQDPRAGPAQAVNHKEPGQHFKVKRHVDGDLPSSSRSGGSGSAALPGGSFTDARGVGANLPDLATLPVYDLHLRPLGPAGGSGLRTLALRGDFVAQVPAFGGRCEWVGMTEAQRRWLDGEEGEVRPGVAAGVGAGFP